ncbi:hypothetical protein [Oceanirhabdus sp. W0125-5]|uniref:hypothetical protein n=1 Tax=Oceanirhabdus sp. W0125-5 TaxID=2999116 RepID=UPI0022F2C9BF|nr:hypothetical protein [Oceanirhabdus sp. W0125-5]WBW95464.1 hypothetical protein OW730_17440 [Oceanirhabdus sp. W0125-5]
MDLEKLIIEYKQISNDIIVLLEKDDFEKLDLLFEKRQVVIDQMILEDNGKNEVKDLYVKYNLVKLDQVMKSKFETKKNEIKSNLIKIRRQKKATAGYNNLNSRAVYLSKEI